MGQILSDNIGSAYGGAYGSHISESESSSAADRTPRTARAARSTSEPFHTLRPQDRAKAAIIGAFVADALSVSSTYLESNDHDDDRVISKFEEQERIMISPVGIDGDPDARPLGRQSVYGDEAFPFLRLISTRGYFDPMDAREEACMFLNGCKTKNGFDSDMHPVMKQFMERRASGQRWEECSSKDDIQFLAVTKVPILVARYAGSPSLLDKVEEAVKIYQTHPKVLAACRLSARLLERVVLGHSVADTLLWAVTLAEASERAEHSHSNLPRGGRRGTKGNQTSTSTSSATSCSTAPSSSSSFLHPVITLDSLEREFLSSILPPLAVPAVAVPYKSYGSCVSGSKNNPKNFSVTASVSASEFDETKGIEGGDSAYADNLKNNDSRDCASAFNVTTAKSMEPHCVSATGALNYYLGCRPSSQDNPNNSNYQNNEDNQNYENHRNNQNNQNSVNYDNNDHQNTQIDRNSDWCYRGGSPKRQNGRTAHHRRSLSGTGGTGAGCLSVPFSLAVEEIGLTAQLPDSLQASLYGLLIFHSYKTAIRANVMTRGDNVCRSWLIGAMLAAEHGVQSIPKEWLEQTLLHSQISSMAHRLAGSNPYFETLKEKGCKLSVLLS